MRALIALTCIVVLVAYSHVTVSVLGATAAFVMAAAVLLAIITALSFAKDVVATLAISLAGCLLGTRDRAVWLIKRTKRHLLKRSQEPERARRVAAVTSESISLLRKHVEGKRHIGVTLVRAYWRVVYDYGLDRGHIRPELEAALPAALDEDAELVVGIFDYDRMGKVPGREKPVPTTKIYAYRLSEGRLRPLPARGMRVTTAMVVGCLRNSPNIEHMDAPALGLGLCPEAKRSSDLGAARKGDGDHTAARVTGSRPSPDLGVTQRG